VAIDQELSNHKPICILCSMSAHGFVVQFNPNVHLKKTKTLVPEIGRKFPQYVCCSMKCQEGVLRIVQALRGIMSANTITAMEKTAINDAKQSLFDALTAIGAADAFQNQSAQNMEYLIWAIWCGVRASMQRQSATGEVPF
jgi:hypothetical protein